MAAKETNFDALSRIIILRYHASNLWNAQDEKLFGYILDKNPHEFRRWLRFLMYECFLFGIQAYLGFGIQQKLVPAWYHRGILTFMINEKFTHRGDTDTALFDVYIRSPNFNPNYDAYMMQHIPSLIYKLCASVRTKNPRYAHKATKKYGTMDLTSLLKHRLQYVERAVKSFLNPERHEKGFHTQPAKHVTKQLTNWTSPHHYKQVQDLRRRIAPLPYFHDSKKMGRYCFIVVCMANVLKSSWTQRNCMNLVTLPFLRIMMLLGTLLVHHSHQIQIQIQM